MEIEKIQDPSEISAFMDVIKSAWNTDSALNGFKDTIHSMAYHGGFVLAAYDNSEIVGISFSYPGYRHGKTYLYSHMTGVISDKKYSGVGYMLKKKQMELAREYGYDLIAWTFDPMMSLNAYFNINKLGAFSRTYIDNFYGEMHDGINAGLPTDRLVAEWYINDDYDRSYDNVQYINFIDASQFIVSFNLNNLGSTIGLKIFPDFISLKNYDIKKALEIKLQYRDILKRLFNSGYVIINFEKLTSSYILKKNYKLKQENIFL
ncbi:MULTISPECIES: hypothetical protein [Acidiplasma]|jgi:chorismate synthase|uniref:N-acetyltransferase domain-containing protein n=2 Tax=Acidiplasma TaxID=507753 RepID=A0A0Q0VKP8_9ARCH|nr:MULTISPECIES: hypothetical protein [Acidiplasma]KPV46772.1 hypothetical protein SE19_04110 [Acidiplasma aeolicum]KQB34034.1 hypothetical protein AOG55_01595 [Acidiplasma cupricumulans]KQB36351.1 hypothetical protein AOG54_02200 [Acidiplasma aeolicum]